METLSMNARLAVVSMVKVEPAATPVKFNVLVSKDPAITAVYVTVCDDNPEMVTLILPSTVVHPLTSKDTVISPDMEDKGSEVMEPVAEPEPSLTAPPAS